MLRYIIRLTYPVRRLSGTAAKKGASRSAETSALFRAIVFTSS